MLTKGAIEDLIMQHLSPVGRAAPPAVKNAQAAGKRVFISDWELRRSYKPGSRTVTVPANAIISPLSIDWLDFGGIAVIRGS